MNVGQLFVKLGFKQDPAAPATQSKFLKGLHTLRDKVNDAAKTVRMGLQKGFQAAMQGSELQMFGFVGKLGKLIGYANMARLAIMGMAAAMMKLTMNAAQAAEHLFKFSINTGMDTTALQKWQVQAGMAGVQAEEVADSFKMLQEKSLEAQLGGDTGAFQMAGVNWMADAQTQMQQIQAMLKSRPAAMGTKLAKDMGLNEEMIAFLRMRDSLKPAPEGLILSPDEIAELKDFSIDFQAAWNGFKMALTKLGVMIMPITKPVIKMFSRIMEMTADFTLWLNGLGKWKDRILAIGAAIALAVTMFFFPITATVMGIIAIIAGIALAVEDVYTFFQGGDSFTGDILSGKLFEGLKDGMNKGIEWIKENWETICDWMKDEAGNIFNGLLDGLVNLGKMLIAMIDSVLEKLNMPTINSLLEKADGVMSALGGGIMGRAYNAVSDKVSGWFGGDTPATPAVVGGRALAGAGAGAGVNQSVQINVNGARDPKAVADEVNSRLKRETSNAVHQMPRSEM